MPRTARSAAIEGAEKYEAFDLGALLSRLPAYGSFANSFACLGVWISLFVTQIAYTDVMVVGMQALLGDTSEKTRPLHVLAVTAVALPICFLSQRWLSLSSSVAVAVNIYVLGVLFAQPPEVVGVDAMIIRSDIVNAAVLERAEALWICVRAGAGYDNIDLAACASKGVVAMNTPGQNANAVAEPVLA